MKSQFDRSTPYEVRTAQRPSNMKWQRYTPFAPIELPDRTWPSKVITQAPRRHCPPPRGIARACRAQPQTHPPIGYASG